MRLLAVGRRLARLLVRAFGAPPRDVVEAARAQWALLLSLAALNLRLPGRLVRPITLFDSRTGPADEVRLRRIAVAVDRASRWGLFHPTCLVRAMALERLIHRAGAGRAVVRVGIRHEESDLQAHAWIEVNGRVLGDHPEHVGRFKPLTDVSALPG